MLSPEAPLQVDANALVTSLDPETIRDQLEAGFRVFKLKVGARSLEEDRSRLDSLRTLLGGRAQIRLDANGVWPDVETARASLRAVGTEGVESLEQPMGVGTEHLWAPLRDEVPLLAADESAVDEATCRTLVDGGGIDALVLKPARIGSLGACLRIASQARAAGVVVWVTTMLEGLVGRAASLHLSAALGREGVRPHGLLTGGLLAGDHAPERWPDAPNLGIDVHAPGLGFEL